MLRIWGRSLTQYGYTIPAKSSGPKQPLDNRPLQQTAGACRLSPDVYLIEPPRLLSSVVRRTVTLMQR